MIESIWSAYAMIIKTEERAGIVQGVAGRQLCVTPAAIDTGPA